MKLLFTAMFLFLVSMSSGCSSGTTTLSTGLGGIETVSTDVGRFTAWSLVEGKKVQAIQAIETAQAKTPTSKELVTVNLSTPEAIREWSQYQTVVALKDSVVEMARALRPRHEGLKASPMPKGAFAEGVDSATGFISAVGNSPVGVATVVGHFVGAAAKDAGPKVTATEGSEVTMNDTQAVSLGSGAATTTGTAVPTVVDPVIVEPVVVQ